MPKEEWGVKRVCPETGKRFYDLNKTPVVSPYTGEVVEIDTGNKSRTMVADKEDANSKSKQEDVVEGDELLDDDDDTSNVDLGDDVLEDDDEDTVPLEEIADVATNDDD